MNISATALLTAAARARRVDISQDRYALLWTQGHEHEYVPELNAHYTQSVCDREDMGLSLRNRFFLRHLNSFIDTWGDVVFVNLAAGFTSYPYLVEKPITALEVDLPAVVESKRRLSKELQQQKLLPYRDVAHWSIDLSDRTALDVMAKNLCPLVQSRPVFVLMEGISYYLERDIFEYILAVFSALDSCALCIGFDFWHVDARNHAVFNRLSEFYDHTLGWRGFTLFDENSAWWRDGFRVAELTDAIAQEAELIGTSPNTDSTFPEYYVILTRQ